MLFLHTCHGTTAHNRHSLSRTDSHCHFPHRSRKGSRRAHLRLPHHCDYMVSCCFLTARYLVSTVQSWVIILQIWKSKSRKCPRELNCFTLVPVLDLLPLCILALCFIGFHSATASNTVGRSFIRLNRCFLSKSHMLPLMLTSRSLIQQVKCMALLGKSKQRSITSSA